MSVVLHHRETQTHYRENTKAPADPVYLAIDHSLVNRKQSTQ